jgi:uncharacterized protein (TIRG00374 family)
MTELSRPRRGIVTRIASILRPAISVLLLAAILYFMDWGKLRDAVGKLSLSTCLAAGFVTMLAQIITGLRWYVMIRRLSTGSFSWHLRHYSLACFLNSFTPANLGGDIYRLVALRRAGNSSLDAAFLLLRERYFGLLGYCSFFMICVAAIFAGGNIVPRNILNSSWAVGIVLLLMIFLAPLLRFFKPLLRANPWLNARLTPLLAQTRQAVGFPLDMTFLLCIALTLLNVACWALAATVICRDLGLGVSYWAVGVVAVLVELARWIPVSVQGIGVREGLYSVLLGLFGVPAATGFVVGAILYIVLSGVLALAGAFAVALGLIDRGSTKHAA